MRKVLIINSVCGYGSTGRICTSIATRIKSAGDEVIVAYGRGTTDYQDSYKIGNKLDQIAHGIITRLFDKHGLGSKISTMRFLHWASRYNPDLVWLHNIHGYYINYEILFAWIKSRPNMQVNWTLHDCWSFTGHCAHYMTIDCDRWSCPEGCNNCQLKQEYPATILHDNSKSNFYRKKRAFIGVNNMTLIVPSLWLASEVKKSFLKEYKLQVENNAIDKTIFKPTVSDFREHYGLQNKIVILGVSSIWNEKKGLYDYIDLAERLGDKYYVVLVGTGLEKIAKLKPENLITIQRTDSAYELAGMYTMADWFVNLTYEDNYPTVNIEAEACGTPVITYDTGGCRETICLDKSLVIKKGKIDDIISKITCDGDDKTYECF